MQAGGPNKRRWARFSRAILLVLGGSLPSCSSITEFPRDEAGSSSSTSTSSTGSIFPTSGDPESSSSSGMGTSSGSDSTTGEPACTGATFVDPYCPPDVPQVEMCNVWDDDCPRGEKCNIWSTAGNGHWDATRCVPLVPNPAGPGEPCTAQGNGLSGFDDCETSSVCLVSNPDTLEGECMPMCTGSENAPVCEDPNRVCTAWSEAIPAYCVERCDPLEPDSCPEGAACYPGDSTSVCASDVSGPDMGGAFDLCEAINACASGLFCAGATVVGACPPGASLCCTPWCDLTDPDCPEPTTCIPAYDRGSVPPGHEDVGICGQQTTR